jgi:hypothetical protein
MDSGRSAANTSLLPPGAYRRSSKLRKPTKMKKWMKIGEKWKIEETGK